MPKLNTPKHDIVKILTLQNFMLYGRIYGTYLNFHYSIYRDVFMY